MGIESTAFYVLKKKKKKKLREIRMPNTSVLCNTILVYSLALSHHISPPVSHYVWESLLPVPQGPNHLLCLSFADTLLHSHAVLSLFAT